MEERIPAFVPERGWEALLEGHPDPECCGCRDIAIHLAFTKVMHAADQARAIGNERAFLASHHRSFC